MPFINTVQSFLLFYKWLTAWPYAVHKDYRVQYFEFCYNAQSLPKKLTVYVWTGVRLTGGLLYIYYI